MNIKIETKLYEFQIVLFFSLWERAALHDHKLWLVVFILAYEAIMFALQCLFKSIYVESKAAGSDTEGLGF